MEEDFPRGRQQTGTERKKPFSHQKSAKRRYFSGNDDGNTKFSLSNGDDSSKKRKCSSKFVKDKFESVWTDRLNDKVINSNTLALACVASVLQYEVRLELVDGITATVPISAVSDDFSAELLKLKSITAKRSATTAKDPATAVAHALSRIFRPGQLLIVKINEVKSSFSEKKGGKFRNSKKKLILATTNPKDVNENLIFTNMERGQVLMASVKRVEEKGYVMELGSRLSGFLPFTACAVDPALACTGQVLMCSVAETVDAETRVVKLSCRESSAPQLFTSGVHRKNQLLPGIRLTGTIEKILPQMQGVFLNFGNDLLGYVSKSRLKTPFDAVTSYEVGEEVKCTVMYYTPNSNVIGFSAQSHLNEKFAYLDRKWLFGGFTVGDQCYGEVKSIPTKGGGVYFELENEKGAKFNAFCPKHSLQHTSATENDDAAAESADKISVNQKKYAPGSKHPLRITGWCLMNRLLHVSDSKSLLNQPIVDVEHAVPGTYVQATAVKLLEKGVLAKLYGKINGLVPTFFIDDSSSVVKLKKKFSPGKSFKARILYVELHKNRLILTAKRAQVKSEHALVTSYDSQLIGSLADGVVVHVTATGLLVAFYNEVKGYASLIGLDDTTKKNFIKGHVITVRVEKVDPERKKMQLKIEGVVYNPHERNPSGESWPNLTSIGMNAQFNAVVVENNATGLKIRASVNDVTFTGHLPAYHLTDTVTDCSLLLSTFKIGDTVGPCVVFSKGGTLIVSAKPKIVEVVSNKTNLTSFDQLEEGHYVVGVIVRLHQDMGYFVELPGFPVTGLVPIDSVDQSDEGAATLAIGQTVMGRIQKIDVEKHRFRLSLKLPDSLKRKDRLMTSFDLLKLYLKEQEKILSHFRQNLADESDSKRQKIAEECATPGTVVRCTINNVTDFGVICTLWNGVKGVAVMEHLDSKSPPRENRTAEAVLIRVDLSAVCVELSFLPDLVKRAKSVQKKKRELEKLIFDDQRFRAIVVHTRNDIILVSLLDHAEGLFAYMPGRLHFNDLTEHTRFKVGERISVIVKEKYSPSLLDENSQHFYLVTELNNEKLFGATAQLLSTRAQQPGQGMVPAGVTALQHFVSVQPGKIYDAQVLDISDNNSYVNLFINKSQLARVHVSELADDFQNGQAPLTELSIGKSLRVKVIDFRKSPNDKSVRIAECTAKPSKLISKNNKKRNLGYRQAFTKGERIWAFVDQFKNDTCQMIIDPDWRGTASIFDLSDDLEILKNRKEYFTKGCAFQCYVVSVQTKEKRVRLSVLNPNDRLIRLYKSTVAKIVAISKGTHIRLTLPDGSRAVCSITDVCENFDHTPTKMSAMRIGEFCHVIPVSLPKGGEGWRVSMRKIFLRENINADQSEASAIKSDDQSLETTLTMTNKSTDQSESSDVVDPIIDHVTDLKPGRVVRGFVKKATFKTCLWICLGHKIVGRLSLSKFFARKKAIAESSSTAVHQLFPIGSLIRCKVVSVNSKNGNILLELTSDEQKSKFPHFPEKTAQEQEDSAKIVVNGQRKIVSECSMSSEKVVDPPRLQVDGGFTWRSDRFSMKNLIQVGLEKIFDEHAGTNESSNTDKNDKVVDNNDDSGIRAKKPKLEKRKETEADLLQKELKLLHPDMTLESEEDFDRLLMGSPDSSELWLRYMAMFIQSDEIAKARLVAERALKTISLREENERFNIWTALLNLENVYGTHESLKSVFDRAKQVNDPFKVYRQLLKIYQRTGKSQEADELVEEMLKKFKSEFDAWILAGEHFYLHEPRRMEKSRELLKRAMKSMIDDEQKKVDLISRFAQMEFKFADSERGKTLFEGLLNEHPKRMDIWSVYADMVIKYRSPEEARVIFERATSLKLPVQKLKAFYHKWSDFEQRFGTDETKSQVQTRLNALIGNNKRVNSSKKS